MAAPVSQPAPLRVLLLDADAQETIRLAIELGVRGVAVRPCPEQRAALALLAEHGADAVVLAAPLGDDDWIAAAAAIRRARPGIPLVLVDDTGQGIEVGSQLPPDWAPDAVLPRRAPPVAVLLALREALHGRRIPALSFGELLVALRGRGESGLLEVRAGEGICTRILLRDGEPVFAEGGALRETLGRLLLRRGTLSESDYLRVIERMTERLIENEATRMGEVLVELGLLSLREVFEALAAQVQEKILGCFRWETFEHRFEPLAELPDEALAYGCPPLETLVLAGIRQHVRGRRLAALLAPHESSPVRLRGDPKEVAERFGATPAEQRVLHELDGSATVAELCARSPLGARPTGQLLAALIVARGVEIPVDEAPRARPQPPAAARPQAARLGRIAVCKRPATGTDAQPTRSAASGPRRDGATSAAAPPRAKATPRVPRSPQSPAEAPEPATLAGVVSPAGSAADAAVTRPHPLSPDSLAKLRRELARSGAAPPLARAPAGERTASLEAERAYRQGLQLLAEPALPGAWKAFARACEHNPDEPEYAMMAAWVETLLAKDEATRTEARERVRTAARHVLQRDPDSARAHCLLGHLATTSGELDLAERHFRAALRTAPDDHDARRGLRLLQGRRTDRH